MSRPISNCLVIRAANGDEKAFESLREVMTYNLKCGHWSQVPCSHNPPCGPLPSDEQLQALSHRFEKELQECNV